MHCLKCSSSASRITLGTDLVRLRERSVGNQGIDETRSAEDV
jgi:hypothetical protein